MNVTPIKSSPVDLRRYQTVKSNKKDNNYKENNGALINQLNSLAMMNNLNFKGNKYELNLSTEELKERTDKDHFIDKVMLKPDAVEYTSLKDGDKQALKHLVKAAYILDRINLQIDNPHNLEVKEYLEKESKKGNKDAIMTKKLFDGQKGVSAVDRQSNQLNLIKGAKQLDGRGVYPEDLSKDEFHGILINMLNEGKDEKVKNILSSRTVVERDGDELVGVDYVDKFKDDFKLMADELDKASETSTNKDFNEYLTLQSLALRTANPKLDAFADKKWATLQDTPLEFTITRENYDETMTNSISENKVLSKMLDERGIVPVTKDYLGGRVGIVNKEGTDKLLEIKKYLPMLAENMPYQDEYEQNITPNGEVKQTMVDVDLVALTGDVGAYRGGITLAENLPNDDKPSLKIGGGRRNVYHRQIRANSNPDSLKKHLDASLDKDQHKYYLTEASHWFTIGHENAHSLGPKYGKEKLGKYQSIIEENKADMGSLAFVDMLTEKGMYTPEQRKQIIVTATLSNYLAEKPNLGQAHRVRSVMQAKYFEDNGAVEISDEGKVHVNIDKVVPTAQKMLSEIIEIQKDGDLNKAEKYMNQNFVWTDSMERVAKNLRKVDHTTNGGVKAELAEKLLNE
jgi:hypothetical protein